MEASPHCFADSDTWIPLASVYLKGNRQPHCSVSMYRVSRYRIMGEEKKVEAVLPEREPQGSQNHFAVCLLSNK